MTRERLAALVKEYNDTYWNGEDDEQLISLLERVAEEARDETLAKDMAAFQAGKAEQREADAKIAETPDGHYQIGTGALPYWDGKRIARAIREAK